MAKNFASKFFAERTSRSTASQASKAEKRVAGSDLSQAAKRDKVTKALSTGSKKSGTFEYHNAGKRA